MSHFDKAGFATDPTLREATYISLTQAELSYSIIGATITAARTSVTDLVTYYNGGRFGGTSSGFGGSRSDTYVMRSLKSTGKGRSEYAHWESEQQLADEGGGDADSQELIIGKDTTIQVSSENGK